MKDLKMTGSMLQVEIFQSLVRFSSPLSPRIKLRTKALADTKLDTKAGTKADTKADTKAGTKEDSVTITLVRDTTVSRRECLCYNSKPSH